jgi:hypothetical protein
MVEASRFTPLNMQLYNNDDHHCPAPRWLRDRLAPACQRPKEHTATREIPLQSVESVTAMQSERLRMRAELLETIAAAQRTVARSRALLAQADVIPGREKFPLLVPRP